MNHLGEKLERLRKNRQREIVSRLRKDSLVFCFSYPTNRFYRIDSELSFGQKNGEYHIFDENGVSIFSSQMNGNDINITNSIYGQEIRPLSRSTLFLSDKIKLVGGQISYDLFNNLSESNTEGDGVPIKELAMSDVVMRGKCSSLEKAILFYLLNKGSGMVPTSNDIISGYGESSHNNKPSKGDEDLDDYLYSEYGDSESYDNESSEILSNPPKSGTESWETLIVKGSLFIADKSEPFSGFNIIKLGEEYYIVDCANPIEIGGRKIPFIIPIKDYVSDIKTREIVFRLKITNEFFARLNMVFNKQQIKEFLIQVFRRIYKICLQISI